ncbi:MAG: Integral membrane protein MviN [Parcubacteria group bacterium GW2011_GWD2_42_14]|nr:MAG: Integral membrane protein MviN [Parcubacteria group bacterium GW2011_GWD2_42_14]
MSPRRVIDLLHKEVRGLHEAAYLLAFFTFGSQLFALVRDRMLAHSFGTGETLDVFYAAFRIPDTMYAFLASMVSLFVLIPFLEAAGKEGLPALKAFLSDMFSFFSFALIGVGGIAWLFAPQLVELLYSGFSPTMQADLVPMIRILLLQPLLLGISNLFAAYVQIRGRFLLYAIAPILYNIGIIIGILFLQPLFGTNGLAWGVVLGAVLHLGVQTPFMVTNNMLPRLTMPNWRRVYEVVRISIPRTITLTAQQVVVLVMIALASRYVAGSVSAFSFAWNLQSVPLAIIGVSYSVAAFPKLSRLFGNGETEEYKNLILVATRQILFWAIPAVVFIVVLRAQIVRVVLGSGAFDWDATKMTAAILALLALSLVAQGVTVLLVRACYAAGKTKIPLMITAVSSILTIVLAVVSLHLTSRGMVDLTWLADIMRVSGVLSTEVLLIAISYSIGSMVTAALLFIHFERASPPFSRGLFSTFWQSIVSALVAGFATYLALNLITKFVQLDTLFGIGVQGLLAGIVGVCVWTVVLVSLGNKDIVVAWTALQKKLTKTRIEEVRGSIEGV